MQNTCQPDDSIRFNALICDWLSNPETFQMVRVLSLRLSCCFMSVQYCPMEFACLHYEVRYYRIALLQAA